MILTTMVSKIFEMKNDFNKKINVLLDNIFLNAYFNKLTFTPHIHKRTEADETSHGVCPSSIQTHEKRSTGTVQTNKHLQLSKYDVTFNKWLLRQTQNTILVHF